MDTLFASVEAFGAEVVPLWSDGFARTEHLGNVQRAPLAGEEMSWAAQHLAGAQIEGVLCSPPGN